MMILGTSSGCKVLTLGIYQPVIPARPILSAPIRTMGATMCLATKDLRAITRWGSILELELEAACMALGNPEKECIAHGKP